MVVFVKAKTDDSIFLCRSWRSSGGSSGLFFLIVPTRASFLLRSSSAKANGVKQFSHVTVCPWSPSVSRSVTIIPWLTSRELPGGFPV